MRATLAIVALGLVAGASRFGLLARSPHEWDEFLFTHALDDYDLARHHPHPPGYPVFVLLARGARTVLHESQLSLAATGAAGGVLGVLAVFAFARLFLSWRSALYAALLFAVHPVVWITSLRGLSDVPGMALSLLAVTMLLAGAAASPGAPGLGLARAFGAGALGALAIGTRQASLFLVLPALAYFGIQRLRVRDGWPVVVALWAFGHVCSLWLAGLVVDSGGVGELATALGSQAEGFYRRDSLVSNFSLPGWWAAWTRVWIDPWGLPAVGWLLSGLAVLGWFVLGRRDGRAPVVAALVIFGGYALFDSLFMATGRYRYHVYLVPMVVVGALAWDPWRGGEAASRDRASGAAGAGAGPRLWVHLPPLLVIGLLAGWTYPLARIQHREEPPIVRAMHGVEQGWSPHDTLLHVHPAFVAAVGSGLADWPRSPVREARAPSDGRRLVRITAEPDFWAGEARTFEWDRRLLDLVAMHATPHVAERRVFPRTGFHGVEGAPRERWVWTERVATMDLIVPESGMDLVLRFRAPVDPLTHRLVVKVCGRVLADLPVYPDPVTHRFALPRSCTPQPAPVRVSLRSSMDFVPAQLDPASSDARRLAVRFDHLGVERSGR